MTDLVIGSDRLWCPETFNGMVGICADLVIASGHAHLYAWRLPEGTLVATWPRHRELLGASALQWRGDVVWVEAGGRRYAVDVSSGDLQDLGEAPPPARVSRREGLLEVRAGTGTHLLPWPAHPRSLAVSADGRRLAIGDLAQTTVLEVASGGVVWRGPRGEPALSADGRWLALGHFTRARLTVVDLDTGLTWCPDEPELAPDELAVAGGCLVATGGGGAAACDLATGARRANLPGVRSRLRPRGAHVIAETGDGVGRWDPRTGEALAFVPLPGLAQAGSFDRGGRRFAGVLYRLPGGLRLEGVPGVWLADLDTGVVQTLDTDDDPTRTAALSPDGELLAVCDREGLCVHRVAPGFPVITHAPGGANRMLAFSPDGTELWVGPEDEGGQLVSLATGVSRPFTPPPGCQAWLDGGFLAVTGSHVHRIDAETHAVLETWSFPAAVIVARLDGEHLAVTLGDGTLRVRHLGDAPSELASDAEHRPRTLEQLREACERDTRARALARVPAAALRAAIDNGDLEIGELVATLAHEDAWEPLTALADRLPASARPALALTLVARDVLSAFGERLPARCSDGCAAATSRSTTPTKRHA